MTSSKFTEHQQKVLDSLKPRNKDIPISKIFLAVYGIAAWREKGITIRDMQQKLAPTFAEINSKLKEPHIIKPGFFKQTYRYSTKPETNEG